MRGRKEHGRAGSCTSRVICASQGRGDEGEVWRGSGVVKGGWRAGDVEGLGCREAMACLTLAVCPGCAMGCGHCGGPHVSHHTHPGAPRACDVMSCHPSLRCHVMPPEPAIPAVAPLYPPAATLYPPAAPLYPQPWLHCTPLCAHAPWSIGEEGGWRHTLTWYARRGSSLTCGEGMGRRCKLSPLM